MDCTIWIQLHWLFSLSFRYHGCNWNNIFFTLFVHPRGKQLCLYSNICLCRYQFIKFEIYKYIWYLNDFILGNNSGTNTTLPETCPVNAPLVARSNQVGLKFSSVPSQLYSFVVTVEELNYNHSIYTLILSGDPVPIQQGISLSVNFFKCHWHDILQLITRPREHSLHQLQPVHIQPQPVDLMPIQQMCCFYWFLAFLLACFSNNIKNAYLK